MSKGKKRRRPVEAPGVEKTPAVASPPASSLRQKKLVLMLFGGALLVLFVALLLLGGDSNSPSPPKVPPGYVAVVEGADGKIAKISEEEFKRNFPSFLGTLKEVPQKGSQGLANVQASTLGSLLQGIWVREEAKELGISVSGKELAAKVARLKKRSPGLLPAPARLNAEERLLVAKLRRVEPDYNSPPAKKWIPRTSCAAGFFSLGEELTQIAVREYCGAPRS